MDQDQNDGTRDRSSLDEEMERDTEIRRDTQVRGSLGLPPSGESGARERESGVPEFDSEEDAERVSER